MIAKSAGIPVTAGLSLAILDLDSFKFYTILYGHLAEQWGFRQDVGKAIKSAIKRGLCVPLSGGDEFADTLPPPGMDTALQVETCPEDDCGNRENGENPHYDEYSAREAGRMTVSAI